MSLRQREYPHKTITINPPEIAKGTLMAIIKQSGLNREEFLKRINK
ncbi:MAG TPA: hypothetical protein VJB90_03305 [Candidatus Nanoarchaeia archaeon]|nr:hypothetical protein [Candidatus Nanoarchaeia archaeon]